MWRRTLTRRGDAARDYREASRRIEAALAKDPTRDDVRDLLGDVLLERVALADVLRDNDARDELVGRLSAYDADGGQRSLGRAVRDGQGAARPRSRSWPRAGAPRLARSAGRLVGRATGRAPVREPILVGERRTVLGRSAAGPRGAPGYLHRTGLGQLPGALEGARRTFATTVPRIRGTPTALIGRYSSRRLVATSRRNPTSAIRTVKFGSDIKLDRGAAAWQ